MPRVLVIDHYDSYTYNLVHLLAAVTGELPDVLQHDDPRARARWRDGYTHLVLSPGPGSVQDEADFSVGREIVAEATVPVLGVCLGLQGLVHALGGEVAVAAPAHGDVCAIRHVGVGLFAGVPQCFSAVRYQSRAAVRVPEELRVTAWCGDEGGSRRIIMGVEHRQRALHAVQFHPESVLTEHGAALAANFVAMS